MAKRRDLRVLFTQSQGFGLPHGTLRVTTVPRKSGRCYCGAEFTCQTMEQEFCSDGCKYSAPKEVR